MHIFFNPISQYNVDDNDDGESNVFLTNGIPKRQKYDNKYSILLTHVYGKLDFQSLWQIFHQQHQSLWFAAHWQCKLKANTNEINKSLCLVKVGVFEDNRLTKAIDYFIFFCLHLRLAVKHKHYNSYWQLVTKKMCHSWRIFELNH